MTVIYPPYSIQALRWQPLSAAPSARSTVGDSAALRAAQDKLREALQEKQWLLEENQHPDVPPTHLDDANGRIFSMGDFVKRADEAREMDVQQCALDENGERRLLTQEQLTHLKQSGELDVRSELFENQYHTWKVAPGFYSGSHSIASSFREGFGKALDHYVVYTGDAVVENDDNRCHLTLRNALINGFLKAGRKVREAAAQLVAGRLQHKTYGDSFVEEILQDAERSYVYYQLRDHDTRCLFDDYSLDVLDRYWEILEKEDSEFAQMYRRPSQQYRAERKVRQKIESIRRVFELRMESKRRVQLNVDQARALEDPQMALTDFERANEEWAKTMEQAWIDHLQNIADKDFQELGRLEADRLLAVKVEDEVEHEDSEELKEQIKIYESALKKKRPVLYLSNAWRKRKLDFKRKKIEASLQSTRPERIVQRLDDQGLELQSAAQKLAIEFCKDIREPLELRLRSKMSSFPPATFKVLQLDPNHWTFNGDGTINKYKTVKVDLGYTLWRFRYTWMMAVTLTKQMIGGACHFLVSGPLSLRALFSPRPYYAMERPVRDERSLTQTLVSRLQSFHAALRGMRERFDSAPDTGLIGKSIQSFFLRIYLALKGTVGTLVIVTSMFLGTALASALNLTVLTLAPLLATAITIITALFNLVIYDTAFAAARRRGSCNEDEMPSCLSPLLKICIGVPYLLIFPGILQGALAALRLAVVHPIIGTSFLSWAALRCVMRSLRDSFTWPFIRKYSRIPASNTFLAWRIHGPGLAPIEYYRLPVDMAKAGVLLILDKYRLHAHAEVRRTELNAPYDRYSELFTQLVQPFGLSITLGVPSPSAIASRIAWKSQSRQLDSSIRNIPSSVPRISEHVLDIWDAVAEGIRVSHPDFQVAQERHEMDQWEATEMVGQYFSDENIVVEVDDECSERQSLSKTELPVGEIVHRAGKLLAEWNLKMSGRDHRLNWAVSIPPSARGRFRMSEAEQQELWTFTLVATELYGQQIKEEIEEILETSEFSKEIQKTAAQAVDSFYTHSGARSGQDIPVVAAFLLQQLLGGFDMFDTLEATDERMVLSPKMPQDDEHLVFWRSISNSVDTDQPWVLMPKIDA